VNSDTAFAIGSKVLSYFDEHKGVEHLVPVDFHFESFRFGAIVLSAYLHLFLRGSWREILPLAVWVLEPVFVVIHVVGNIYLAIHELGLFDLVAEELNLLDFWHNFGVFFDVLDSAENHADSGESDSDPGYD
jgi:hypothetical protein